VPTVPSLLRRRAAAEPDSVALVVDGGDSVTFAQWERRSAAVAARLVELGVGPGDRVALLFDNRHWTQYAAAYLGALDAGAVAVPLGAHLRSHELAHVLGHCQAVAVVCPPELAPAGWSGPLLHPADVEHAGSDAPPHAVVSPGDLAEILYTSGTTGTPKGVACSHESLVFGVDEGATLSARVVHAFPLGTNAGQEAVRLPLRQPGTVTVVLPTFDPERLAALVAADGSPGLHLFLVPAMAQMIVDWPGWRPELTAGVEQVVLTSAPTPPALLPRVAAAFPKSRISNVYSLTESGPARTVMVYDPGRPGSVGRPNRRSEVRVVDDAGRDVATGQTGEIWLRTRGAPRREYYRDPDATAGLFAGDWLRTGDLGRLDDEGYLYLVDRKKDLIISGGFNVSSLEVETVLGEHPAVSEAAVFATPHEVLGQDVAAAVVLRPGASVTDRELQAFVRRRLAEHKTPRRVFFVDGLPRNASGKVLKAELRGRFAAARPTPEPAPAVAGGPVVETIVDVWREVLGVADMGASDDFFEAGGHSLAAASAAARLGDAFGITLDATAVFEAPTACELAALVESRRG
jgi:acyl-CoA synthetase (AMP-forming)/AMP-acid ligase II/acyl carrier protein